MSAWTIDQANRMTRQQFVQAFGGVFEHSPWVAEQACEAAPFADAAELHAAMVRAVREAGRSKQLELLQAHPDLAARMKMTAYSTAEQQGAGLDGLTPEEFEAFAELNRRYAAKFGFPFIMAVRGATITEIRRSMEERLERPLEREWEQALAEIERITRFRLFDLIRGDAEAGNGALTTHVLDMSRGRPASGMRVQLWREAADGRLVQVADDVTNDDGRLTRPLLEGDAMREGVYELSFWVGEYFGSAGTYLERVPVRFRIAQPGEHYHIPLLVAPGGYSTYRGS